MFNSRLENTRFRSGLKGFFLLQGADIPILKDRLYKPNDFLVIEMGQDLDLLNYTLETSFVGKLRNDNTGLYRSQYKTAAGNTK